MFPQRNFGLMNEDGRLHRVLSGMIKGRGFSQSWSSSLPFRERGNLFHQTGNAGKSCAPNMPWEKHMIWYVCCQEGDRTDSGKLVIFSGSKFSEGRFSLGQWHCRSVSHQLPLHALYAIGPSLRPEGKGQQFKLEKMVLSVGNSLSI